jgi:hypothetical protein
MEVELSRHLDVAVSDEREHNASHTWAIGPPEVAPLVVQFTIDFMLVH